MTTSPRWDGGPALKGVALAAVLGGMACLAEGSWIHAKAALAQFLISIAWTRVQASSEEARPWAWADTRPVAKLTVGEGGQARDLFVLEGASGRNLAFGPVHDAASVAPGERGNSVIEGHRDTHFAVLRDLHVGDTLQVQTPGRRKVRFAVSRVEVVDSRMSRIALSGNAPRLTLVTCYPFDAVIPGGPLRWVVTADAEE